MSSLSSVGRFAAAYNKDRKSLCRFTFADGRRCCIFRSPGHPHLCSDHARKESQARAADKLARDLSFFFSGEYLSACDLTAALGHLIVSVARGDIKPRSARTLAYLAQTLVQTIHLAQDEYINAFDTNGWRRAVRNSVKSNHDHLFPPVPKAEQSAAAPSNAPQPAPSAFRETQRNAPSAPRTNLRSPSSQPPSAQAPVNCHSERSEARFLSARFLRGESAFSESKADPSQTTPAQQAAPSPRTPMPPTTAEFAHHVVADMRPVEKSSPPLTRLESTHAQSLASVDSKPLA